MQFLEIFITTLPTPREIIGNSNLEWIFESQIFERKYEAKTIILGRLEKGSNQNNLHGRCTTWVGRGMDIFLNNALFFKNYFSVGSLVEDLSLWTQKL